MQDVDALEHTIDRNTSFAALLVTGSTGAFMASISMSPQVSSLTSIFAGAVAGSVGYFGLKYFAGVQIALNKSREERVQAAKRIRKFGPGEALVLALTIGGTAAVTHHINESSRDIYEQYQHSLDALPTMDPDTIMPGTNATASEVFCADYMVGKTLVRRFDGQMMSLDCSVK